MATAGNVTSTFFNVLYPQGALTARERGFLAELVNQVDLRAAAPQRFPALSEIMDYPSCPASSAWSSVGGERS